MVGLGRYCCVEARRARQMPERSGVVPVTLYFWYRGILVICRVIINPNSP